MSELLNMSVFDKKYPKKEGEFYYADVTVAPAKHVIMPESEIQHAKEMGFSNFRSEFDIDEQCQLELFATDEHLSKQLLCKDYYQEGSIYLYENNLAKINDMSDLDKKNEFICGFNDDNIKLGSYAFLADNKEVRVMISSDIDAVTFGVRRGIDKFVLLIEDKCSIVLRAIISIDYDKYGLAGEPEIGRFLFYKEDNSLHIPTKAGNWLRVQHFNKIMN